MSFSAHRPGRFGSDGRIEFTTDDDREPQYLDDILAQQRDDADASVDAVTLDDPTEPWGAPPAGDDDTAPFEWPEPEPFVVEPAPAAESAPADPRSEEHTSELQSH